MALETLRRGVARVFWRCSNWNLAREEDRYEGARIMVGAPHTSNFDFVLMLAIAWEGRYNIHWLGKHELFKSWRGPIMRSLGGIAVDRDNPRGVVDEVIERAKDDERFLLVVTPEGTRKGKGWRSGFYRIATGAGLPISLGFADGSTKTAGIGPTFKLTGDVKADMDRIREFYRDKTGVRPEYRTEPRLRDESSLHLGAERAD